jgi:UDP-N-acetyl-D-mannosaminuronate dehydrogenase
MFGRRIAVIGTGYVGPTTGACLASLGHRMACADIDAVKIDKLTDGGRRSLCGGESCGGDRDSDRVA